MEKGEMKKCYLSPYCILLIVGNCIAAIVLAHVAEFVRETYGQMVGGTRSAAGLTVLALGFPRWLWLLSALSVLVAVGLFVRKVPVLALMHCLLIIAILDGVLLFFFALGIGLYFIPPLETIGL
jgi:hypothetical protein